ncbi:MAG TPA: nitroreductase [Allosphingosinicella sp.]|jgi:nitroreductase|nr:nitroreductase [Allosphingosinicella sp.]
MFNDRSTLLSYLATRRSSRPRDLVEPGPDPEQLRRILEIAARTPDHGKLFPWRFVHVARERRPDFAEMLQAAYRSGKSDPPARLEVEAVQRFATQAPELIVLLSSPIQGHKIPVFEQELSCGAVAMNLLHAASALGFGGGWVTGWAAYSKPVLEALGGRPHERIAGFFFLGTGSGELEERPRPALDQVVGEW